MPIKAKKHFDFEITAKGAMNLRERRDSETFEMICLISICDSRLRLGEGDECNVKVAEIPVLKRRMGNM